MIPLCGTAHDVWLHSKPIHYRMQNMEHRIEAILLHRSDVGELQPSRSPLQISRQLGGGHIQGLEN